MQAITLGMHANSQSLHVLGGLICLMVIIVLACAFVPAWLRSHEHVILEAELKSDSGGRVRSLPTGMMVEVVGARSGAGVTSRVWTTRGGEE